MDARKLDIRWREVGRSATSRHAFTKTAGTPEIVHKLGGRLYLSRGGWLLLSVPNALLRGAFDALHAPGAELPVKTDGSLNAHISVMRPEEIAQIGGPDKIAERGHTLYYTLGPVKELTPLSWDDVSKAWVVEVDSPDLRDLRKSYGLSALPHLDHEFHITVAIRRKNVLRDNATAKFTVVQARSDMGRLVAKSAFVAGSASCLDIVWSDVEGDVRRLFPVVDRLVKAARSALVGCRLAAADAVLVYVPAEKRAYLYGVAAKACQQAGFVPTLSLPTAADVAVCVKLAGWLGDAFTGAGHAIGGPTALTNTIVGSLAGGTLGYLGGAAAERLFPEQYLERGQLRRTTAMAGAGLGAAVPLWHAYARYRNAMAANSPTPLAEALTTPIAAPAIKAGGLVDTGAWEPDLDNLKFANFDTGGYVRPVPVDAFNRAVWNDVSPGAAQHNRFGSRSPWGSQEDSLHTPPSLAAATSGLLSGISAMHDGATLLRPSTIASGLVSAGAGLAAANIAGKTLGVLAGLTPAAQRQLQQAGVWAGVLSAVIPPIFH